MACNRLLCSTRDCTYATHSDNDRDWNYYTAVEELSLRPHFSEVNLQSLFAFCSHCLLCEIVVHCQPINFLKVFFLHFLNTFFIQFYSRFSIFSSMHDVLLLQHKSTNLQLINQRLIVQSISRIFLTWGLLTIIWLHGHHVSYLASSIPSRQCKLSPAWYIGSQHT